MLDIISFWLLVSTSFTFFWILATVELDPNPGISFINPKNIYKNVPVNWFGCIFLTIIAHIVVGPLWAFVYWFYKLCTVGRR